MISKVIRFSEYSRKTREFPKGGENFSHFALRRTVYEIFDDLVFFSFFLLKNSTDKLDEFDEFDEFDESWMDKTHFEK